MCGFCGNPEAVHPVALTQAQELVLLEVDALAAALRLKNEDDTGEPGEDAFLSLELVIASAIAVAYDARSKRAKIILEDTWERHGLDRSRTETALGEADAVMSDTFSDCETQVRSAVRETVSVGASQIENGVALLAGVPSVDDVTEGIVRAAKYATNNHFNTWVIPALRAEIEKVIQGTDPTAVPDLAPIRAVMDARLRTVPYWRVVANAAASRGFHYGYLKAARFRGMTGYEWVSVIDTRTSAICRELNGKQFWLADAINLMERVAQAATIEEVKQITPWYRPSDIQGKGADALRDMGLLVPPAHGNCRSTIRTFF